VTPRAPYEVAFKKSAEKELLALPKRIQQPIVDAIRLLAINPRTELLQIKAEGRGEPFGGSGKRLSGTIHDCRPHTQGDRRQTGPPPQRLRVALDSGNGDSAEKRRSDSWSGRRLPI
jgi:hypothetical protein